MIVESLKRSFNDVVFIYKDEHNIPILSNKDKEEIEILYNSIIKFNGIESAISYLKNYYNYNEDEIFIKLLGCDLNGKHI